MSPKKQGGPNIKKRGDKYLVESSSKKGKFYEVDLKKPFCSCPDFMFRELKRHGECKHIKEAREFAGLPKEGKKERAKRQGAEEKILAELRRGPVDSMKFVNKYGDGTLEEMKKRGDIIEEKGEVKILE